MGDVIRDSASVDAASAEAERVRVHDRVETWTEHEQTRRPDTYPRALPLISVERYVKSPGLG